MKPNDLPVVDLSEHREVFKAAVKDLLAQAGMTQKELCRRAAVTKRMLAYFMSGDRFPSPETAAGLADALNMSVGDLRRRIVIVSRSGEVSAFGLKGRTPHRNRQRKQAERTMAIRLDNDVKPSERNNFATGAQDVKVPIYIRNRKREDQDSAIKGRKRGDEDSEEWFGDGFEVHRRDALSHMGLSDEEYDFFRALSNRLLGEKEPEPRAIGKATIPVGWKIAR